MAKKATICLLLLGSVLLLCAPAWGACTTDDDCLYPGESLWNAWTESASIRTC